VTTTPTTKTLADLDALDARRVELAVAANAGFLAAAPFIGRDAETVTRYIADGQLAEQLPHIERAHLWQIVQAHLREHPDLMDLDDEARERDLREHTARSSDLEERARLAVEATDYAAALQHLNDLEAHDPDRRIGPGVRIPLMREALTQRMSAADPTGS